jgi:diguanylate cyclase (GGDEF)-like protein
MRLLRSIFARRPFQCFLKRFDDSNVDDALLHYLVSTLFTSPLALFASMAMGALVTVMAWLMTYEPIFIFYMLLHIVIGAAQLDILRRFKHDSYPTHSRERTLRFDRHFLCWSSLYAVVLGCTAYSLIALSNVANAAPLAVGIYVGFTMAFVNRSASRMRLLSMQVLGTTVPAAVAFLSLDIPNGVLYATGLISLVISSKIVGHANLGKTIALYRAGEENSRMARIDTLTGLANRFAFSEAFDAALAQGDRSNSFAICIVDLDRFKEINDTLGHNVGDRVIVDMGLRIRETIQPDDRLAHLGGDEFVVLVRNDSAGASFGAETAERIVEALSRPLLNDGMPLPASASVGVALYPDHGATAEELLKKADIALYEAKQGGRNIFCVFDASMQSKINDARLFELDIQSAIEESQFKPWFQPIQNICTGSAIGYEALARWRHPRIGIITPGRFIPIAEQSGAIFVIGEQILEKACRAATSWTGA